MQDYLGRERQAQLLGQPTDFDLQRTMGEFLREGYDRFIAPQLPNALQDCAAAPAILSKALGWLRQVQLLGIGEQFQAENTKIMETMSQAIVNCYNKEYDQCVIDNDMKHRTAMLGMYRQASLLGIEGQLDYSKIEKCPPVRSYRVQQTGPNYWLSWSGVICNLEQPFTLTGVAPYASGTIPFPTLFTPTSPTAGFATQDVTVSFAGCTTHFVENGPYRVDEKSPGQFEIIWQATTNYFEHSCGVGRQLHPEELRFPLQPLETNACSQP